MCVSEHWRWFTVACSKSPASAPLHRDDSKSNQISINLLFPRPSSTTTFALITLHANQFLYKHRRVNRHLVRFTEHFRSAAERMERARRRRRRQRRRRLQQRKEEAGAVAKSGSGGRGYQELHDFEGVAIKTATRGKTRVLAAADIC